MKMTSEARLRAIGGKLTAAAIGLLLAGCCSFFPCHPGTGLVGSVLDSKGVPVANTTVTLYGTSTSTDAKGCFKTNLSDALPFTFVVAAAGYKPVEMKALPGLYRVEVRLASDPSQAKSIADWISIDADAYRAAESCE